MPMPRPGSHLRFKSNGSLVSVSCVLADPVVSVVEYCFENRRSFPVYRVSVAGPDLCAIQYSKPFS